MFLTVSCFKKIGALGEKEIRSIELIKAFLSTTFTHSNVEMIIHRIYGAAASMSLESVIESMASIYEWTNK